jgi:hypothetical protein
MDEKPYPAEKARGAARSSSGRRLAAPFFLAGLIGAVVLAVILSIVH